MLYIGLDVGTGGCKASLVDGAGNIITQRYSEYSTFSPAPGLVEIDARTVWQAVCQVLASIGGRDAAAIAVASFGEAAILLDQELRVLGSSIFYTDIRGTEEVADIRNAMDTAQLQTLTGMPLNPMYTANKLLWIKKHQPEVYARTRYIMLFGDYINFMLTGTRTIDYSLASRTMLFDINRNTWSDKVTSALDIDPALFSRPVRSGTIVDTIRPEVAANLGLSSKAAVVAGGHDQVMTALGSGAVTAGKAADGMGSAECLILVMNRAGVTSGMYKHNFCCEPFVFDDSYVTLAFNASSGTAVKWYRDCLEAERAREYRQKNANFYRQLDEECSNRISSLFFLPYVAGSGTPYMDNSTGGAFIGLRVSTAKPEMYRAVLEGICFEMLLNIEMLKASGIELQETVAAGGGSASEVLMQIKADIWGREIRTLESAQAGTIGLALVCGRALGEYPDMVRAAGQIVRYGRSYFPDMTRHAIYRQKFETYKQLYFAIREGLKA